MVTRGRIGMGLFTPRIEVFGLRSSNRGPAEDLANRRKTAREADFEDVEDLGDEIPAPPIYKAFIHKSNLYILTHVE